MTIQIWILWQIHSSKKKGQFKDWNSLLVLTILGTFCCFDHFWEIQFLNIQITTRFFKIVSMEECLLWNYEPSVGVGYSSFTVARVKLTQQHISVMSHKNEQHKILEKWEEKKNLISQALILVYLRNIVAWWGDYRNFSQIFVKSNRII